MKALAFSGSSSGSSMLRGDPADPDRCPALLFSLSLALLLQGHDALFIKE